MSFAAAKCDDATAAKLKANCVEKGWVWDGPNCSCTDSKKLVLTVKDPQLSPELQQKIQQLANKVSWLPSSLCLF